MKLLITAPSTLLGTEVLAQSLASKDVSAVTVLSSSPLDIVHSKLQVVSPTLVQSALDASDACIWLPEVNGARFLDHAIATAEDIASSEREFRFICAYDKNAEWLWMRDQKQTFQSQLLDISYLFPALQTFAIAADKITPSPNKLAQMVPTWIAARHAVQAKYLAAVLLDVATEHGSNDLAALDSERITRRGKVLLGEFEYVDLNTARYLGRTF